MPARSSCNSQHSSDRRSLAERLLSIPLALSEIESPGKLLARVADQLGRELAAEVSVCWPEAGTGPAADAAKAALMLELHDRELLVARLRVRRDLPFTAEEKRLLKQLGKSLGWNLTRLSQRSESRLTNKLNAATAAGKNLQSTAQEAIQSVISVLNAEAGALLQMFSANDRSRVVTTAGAWAEDADEQHHEIACAAAVSGEPALYADNLVGVALASRLPARFVLLLRFPSAQPASAWHLLALRQGAMLMAPHLATYWNTVVLTRLVALNNAAAELSTSEMHDLILDSALELIPGADSGTLLVRRDPQEPFVFRSARGFDAHELVGKTVEPREAQTWYGSDLTGWQQGKPRLMSRDQDSEQFGALAIPRQDAAVTRYGRIAATICLPVLRDGNILAVLNVANLQEPQAFGQDSLEIMHLFGAPLAGLLHRQHAQDLLRQTALIDALTGLANRRAFDAALERELVRRDGRGTNLSVLLLDMKNFKMINDTLGHKAGDRALVAAAEALKAVVRDADLLSRWGGDEFAVILVGASAVQAAITAERLRQAVAAVKINGTRLEINVGFSTSPDDGQLAEGLLAAADEMMYVDKQRMPLALP